MKQSSLPVLTKFPGYRRNGCMLLFLLMIYSGLSAQPGKNQFTRLSPDQQTRLEIKLNLNGQLVYRVKYSGADAVDWSAMGLHLSNGTVIGDQVKIIGTNAETHREPFHWPLGDNDT